MSETRPLQSPSRLVNAPSFHLPLPGPSPSSPGMIMIGVIIGSRKIGINPDNVATPIAASLGDLITLALLSGISWGLYLEQGEAEVTEDATRVDSWVGLGDVVGLSHMCKDFSSVPNHLIGTQFVIIPCLTEMRLSSYLSFTQAVGAGVKVS